MSISVSRWLGAILGKEISSFLSILLRPEREAGSGDLNADFRFLTLGEIGDSLGETRDCASLCL